MLRDENIIGTGQRHKHLVIATDASTSIIDTTQADCVSEFLRGENIHVTLFGLGFAEDRASQNISETEGVLRDLLDFVGGELRVIPRQGGLASERKERPLIRNVMPALNVYKGVFEVAPNMQMMVAAYPGVKVAKVPSLKRVAPGYGGGQVSENKYYQKEETKGEQVDRGEIRQAYLYGGEYVVVTEDQKRDIKSAHQLSMKVYCFVPQSQIKPHFLCSDTDVVVAHPEFLEPSSTAFSSLVTAMSEDRTAAMVRWVKRNNSRAEMYVLFPVVQSKTPNYSLHAIRYPWKEDTRCPKGFGALDDASVGDEAKEAASALIKALTMPPVEADLFAAESYPPNPTLQRFWDVVHSKALHPNDPPQTQEDYITGDLKQDPALWDKATRALKRMREACPLVDRAAQKDKRLAGGGVYNPGKLDGETGSADGAGSSKDAATDGGGGAMQVDAGADASQKKTQEKNVSEDVIQRFEKEWEDAKDSRSDTIGNMELSIRKLVDESEGDLLFDQAAQCTARLREKCAEATIDLQEAFNRVLDKLERDYGVLNDTRPFFKVLAAKGVSKISVSSAGAKSGADEENIPRKDSSGGKSMAAEDEDDPYADPDMFC